MTSEPLEPKIALAGGSSFLRQHIAPLPLPSLALSAVIGLTFANVFLGWKPAAFAATPFLIAYFIFVWRRLLMNGRVLLLACAVIAAVAATQPEAITILGDGVSRMIYLPTFVALLGLLRAAAGVSRMISIAGRHLVNQPPSRRYIALSSGSHFFGILLNIGGLAMLIEMVRDANTIEAAGGDPEIVAWRERRMTVAILRGFAAMAFWSPLGVSFNLLLISVPGLTWGQAGPYGIACALAYIALGWVFDQYQRPKGFRPRPVAHEPDGARALASVVAHVLAVSALTWAVEYLLRLSFQTALLIAVPAYAVAWVYGLQIAHGETAPMRKSGAIMIDRGVAAFPAYANEIAVFAASGFLGAVLVALVPRDALQAFFLSFAVPPGVLAALLTVAVTVMSFLGLNPMIAATILASAVASAQVPNLPKTAIVLSIAAGWACSVVSSPMNSALVMTSVLVNQRPWRIATIWNGAFAVAAIALSAVTAIVVLAF